MENPAATLANMRRRVTATCAQCGKEFPSRLRGDVPEARFCSNACKQRDKYARARRESPAS